MTPNIFTGVVNSNWGVAGNWSNGAVPTATDGLVATFTSTSPNCTINVAAVCNSIDFTNYTHTITMTNQLTVSGNTTLGSAITFAGTSIFYISATAAVSLQSNGKIVNIPLTFGLSGTGVAYTLVDDWTITGAFYTGNMVLNQTDSTHGTVYINGAMNLNTGTNLSGTTTLVFGSGSSLNCSTYSALVGVNINIAAGAGTFTLTGNLYYQSSSIKYISGTTITTGSLVRIYSAASLDLKGSTTLSTTSSTGLNFNNLTMGPGTYTIVLNSPITIIGTFTGIPNATMYFNGSNIYFGGNMTLPSGWNINGTSNAYFIGTGIWSGGGFLNNNFTINTTGTLTISGAVYFSAATSGLTMTYIAGTVVTTGSTLNLFFLAQGFTVTLNTVGINWNIINNLSAGILILTSLLTANTLNVSTVTNTGATPILSFAGSTAGFTVGTLTATAYANGTSLITFVSGLPYNVTSNLSFTYSGMSHTNLIFNTTTPGSQAILTLQQGATQSVLFINATDINSSYGKTIVSYRGVVSNTNNWYIVTNTDFIQINNSFAG
jgi:hypothetical protein